MIPLPQAEASEPICTYTWPSYKFAHPKPGANITIYGFSLLLRTLLRCIPEHVAFWVPASDISDVVQGPRCEHDGDHVPAPLIKARPSSLSNAHAHAWRPTSVRLTRSSKSQLSQITSQLWLAKPCIPSLPVYEVMRRFSSSSHGSPRPSSPRGPEGIDQQECNITAPLQKYHHQRLRGAVPPIEPRASPRGSSGPPKSPCFSTQLKCQLTLDLYLAVPTDREANVKHACPPVN